MKLKAFIFIILLSVPIVFSHSSHAGIVETLLIKDSLKDLKQVIKEVKKYNKSDAKLLRQLRKIIKVQLKDKAACPMDKFESNINVLLNTSADILDLECSDNQNRTFEPRFNHCSSPTDLACVCSHKKHKKDPECKAFLDNNQNQKKCIPQDIALELATKMDNIVNNYEQVFSVDANNNGTSDICEDNL